MKPFNLGTLVAGTAALLVGLSVLPAQAATGHPATPHAANPSAASASTFTPVAPQRVLDTRTPGGEIPARGAVSLAMPSTVPANATAVVLNITGTDSNAPTYLAVGPLVGENFLSSNLNLATGETRANLATVELGAHGVMVTAGPAAVNAIIDLDGYYAPGSGGAGFTPTSPIRMLDTRNSAPVGQNSTFTLDVSQRVPAGATAVVFNLTALDASASTFVTAYADGTSLPLASNLNLVPGVITPNLVTVPISADRKVDLHNAFGSVDLIADLSGYYTPGSGQSFYALAPTRVLDTRETSNPISGHESRTVEMGTWLPPTATAVVFNLTGTNVNATTLMTAYPYGSSLPLASNLNLVPGQTSANLAVVALPNTTNITLFNLTDFVDAVVDVAGYFGPAAAA
ncbi:MAG TPA: hypothetical protein VGM75_01145 [Pseudonocardiaceae bacterium]